MQDIKHVGYTLANGVWTGTVAAWWHLGPLLVQLMEVQELRFTDICPASCNMSDTFNWYILNWFHDGYPRRSMDLPRDFFEEADEPWATYDTEAEALADASRRAIAWARKEAGLS